MASRNENRPPPRNSSIKNVAATKEASRKVAAGKMEKQGGADGRLRMAFSTVTNQTNNAATDADGGGAERAAVDFTKEEVEALLNEKMKRGTDKKSVDLVKRFRLCVRWFERCEEVHVQEKEKLQSEVEAAMKKCSDIETEMKNEIEELKETISDLRKSNSSLEERLVKEESDKLEAINSYENEKEARSEAEKVCNEKSAELEKVLNEKSVAEQKAISNEDLYKRSQEYNMSLQQYNSRLQSDLDTANEAHKQGETEKATIVESLGNARVHNKALQVSLNEAIKKNEILVNDIKSVHEELNLCHISLNEAMKKNEILANKLKCNHEELNLCQVSLNEAIKKNEILANELKCVHEELKQIKYDRDCQMGQVHALTIEIAKYKEYTGQTCTQLDTLMIKTNDLEETCSSQKEQIHILRRQLFDEKEKSKMADLSASETRTVFEEQRRIISQLRDQLADKEFQLVEKEKQRKKLHNDVLELKGNIRVFCRVRPLLPEDSTGTDMVVSYPTSIEDFGRGIELVQSGQKHNFTFDEVFNHEASQQDVFVEISQLVQSALDGYKVCIFAYGQTGSGKTYTMMGRPNAPDQKGLIPRSLEQIFQAIQSLKDLGWKYSMRASILEIYNETIRDLLSSNRSSGNEQTRSENGVPSKQYTIKHDANGNTEVLGLTVVNVSSANEISSLLQQAAQSRSVGRTQMNEQSSRSHFVFTLRICGKDENTGKQVQGVLNLIDLAGSERLSRSGATGDRLKETQAINKSLSSLSDVIFALAKKEEHVPFRNSKLTYLLQPCLGGDSKTLMFVNISPDQSSTGESLCSLRFASRVNACDIGIPRRQIHHTSTRTSNSRLSYG